MSCYCGSKKNFEACCQLIINGEQLAKTPEQLMRSRYSAYACKNATYLYQTYANSAKKLQSIAEIEEWATQTLWLKLNIINSDIVDIKSYSSTTNNQPFPTVEFSALYIHEKTFCELREKSRFIKENQQWRYLDGDIIKHAELSPPKRNSPCLCDSGLKFKHCCLLKLA
ncbi:YchJ family protein [Colwelliaceae bacterium 6441]